MVEKVEAWSWRKSKSLVIGNLAWRISASDCDYESLEAMTCSSTSTVTCIKTILGADV